MAMPQPPPYAPGPYMAQPQGNGMAVAGLVLGLLGLVLFWIAIIGWLLALMGIIFGAIGIAKAKRIGKGKGMAIAGLICGSVGLAAGIVMQVMVIRAFTDYMDKGKRTEASMQLDRIERSIKMFHIERATLPGSAAMMPGPPGSGCTEGRGKIKAKGASEWAAAGWGEMDFNIYEDSLFSYEWTKVSNTKGYVQAVGDLDCDGTLATYRVDIDVIDGNVRATQADSTPD